MAALWCNQYGGRELDWVTENSAGPQPYVLDLTGNPGINPQGGIAWLSYFVSYGPGQGVYFAPNFGGDRKPLGTVTMGAVPPKDPLDNRGTIDFPQSAIVNVSPYPQGLVGNLLFELRGAVTDTVPLYWVTTNVTAQPTTPLPEWDPLARTLAAPIRPSGPPRQIQFNVQFRGCPKLHLGFTVTSDNGRAVRGIPLLKSRVDRIDVAGMPGAATLWIDEASLYDDGSGISKQPDWIQLSVNAADDSLPTMDIRRPLTFTGPARPNRIDLGFKKCWYQVEADYTGGYPISRIAAYDRKGGPSPAETRRRTQRRAFLDGALLQVEVPAHVAIRAARRATKRVWVEIEQPRHPGQDPLGLGIDVVNVPDPDAALLAVQGCDWSAPSALPSHP